MPDAAALALGGARRADGAAMQDYAVAEVRALLRREDGAQRGLDLRRVLSVHEAHAVREPDAVCVHNDGPGSAENVAQDEVCRLLSGTFPPCFASSVCAQATMSRAFVWKKPQERMYCSTSATSASAKDSRVG